MAKRTHAQKPKHRRSAKPPTKKKGFHLEGGDAMLASLAFVSALLTLIVGASVWSEDKTHAAAASEYPATVADTVASGNRVSDADGLELRGEQAEAVKNFDSLRKSLRKPKKDALRELTYGEAKRAGVPPELAHSVAKTESGGNPRAVSSVGACGVMQLMDGTRKDLKVKNCFDAKENVRGGTDYLRQLTDKYEDQTIALIAYNWGMGNTDRWLAKGGDCHRLPKQTLEYVGKVPCNIAISKRETMVAEAR